MGSILGAGNTAVPEIDTAPFSESVCGECQSGKDWKQNQGRAGTVGAEGEARLSRSRNEGAAF